MNIFGKYKTIGVLLICCVFASCKMLTPVQDKDKAMPQSYADSKDSVNSAQIKWKDFFGDKNLVSILDTALKNNLDLMITMQDIEMARNDVRLRKGMLFPVVNGVAGASIEKVGLYSSQGAGDASAEITPGQLVPENLGNFYLGLNTTWEIDVWKKLRNGKKAAFTRYLGSIEGRNFVITNLISEISKTYYLLLSLDNQLDIIRETIKLQKDALEIVKIQKEASVVTELAVKKFEADVLNSQHMEFDVLQQIKESENKINFLMGRYPQAIVRDKSTFMTQLPQQIKSGIPSQLLANRPDIKQAKFELFATKCDVKSAQAEFLPSFGITAGVGFQAFKPSFLFNTPQSLMYNLAGDLVAPLINRSAIKAEFNKAKARQIEAMYNYQKTILNGFVEVSNQLSNINNLGQAFDLKSKQVDALTQSIDIANELFKYGKADYFEVLMTQRDALDAKIDLIKTKQEQFNAVTDIYQALGGGWK